MRNYTLYDDVCVRDVTPMTSHHYTSRRNTRSCGLRPTAVWFKAMHDSCSTIFCTGLLPFTFQGLALCKAVSSRYLVPSSSACSGSCAASLRSSEDIRKAAPHGCRYYFKGTRVSDTVVTLQLVGSNKTRASAMAFKNSLKRKQRSL